MSSAANPRAPKPGSASTDPSVPQEPTGPVASDSLAAESIQDSGGFSENTNATPLGVRGASSTLANTDTSGATILPPAASGADRQRQEQKGLGSDERGTAGGVKYPEGDPPPSFTGTHGMDQGYVGGPSADRETSGYQASGLSSSEAQREASTTTAEGQQSSSDTSDFTSTATSGAAGVRPYVDQAPNYAGVVSGAISSEGQYKPKGANLVEGDIPETKTFTGDVGGQHDPGRVAEEQMLRKQGRMPGEGVGGIRQSMPGAGDGSTGQYDALDTERAGKQGLDE